MQSRNDTCRVLTYTHVPTADLLRVASVRRAVAAVCLSCAAAIGLSFDLLKLAQRSNLEP